MADRNERASSRLFGPIGRSPAMCSFQEITFIIIFFILCGIGPHCGENYIIITSAVLSQYTRVTDDRQATTSYDITETCNAVATFR